MTIDGRVAEVGQKLMPGQRVACDGVVVSGKDAPVLLAVNKPRGIVCTTSDKDRAENIVEFLDYPVRIYPIGRLDKDSEGLLLMTNEGELVNRPDVRGAWVPGTDIKTRPDAEHYAGWAENRRVPGSDSGRETEIRRYFERKEEWLRQCCLAVSAGSHMRLHRNA